MYSDASYPTVEDVFDQELEWFFADHTTTPITPPHDGWMSDPIVTSDSESRYDSAFQTPAAPSVPSSPDDSFLPGAFDSFVDELTRTSSFQDTDFAMNTLGGLNPQWHAAFQPPAPPASWPNCLDASVYSDDSTDSMTDTCGPQTPRDSAFDAFVLENSLSSALVERHDYDFSFECTPVMYIPQPTPLIEKDSHTTFLGANLGQPQQQFLLGTVAASVCAEGRLQADSPGPLTSQDPDPVADLVSGTPKTSSRKRAARGDHGIKKPTKRPRKQSKEKTLFCSICGQGSARKNNLEKHIKSVHYGERPHSCRHPGCERAFSRKNDAERHFQSEHTDLGSPRKKSARK
ncbi:hypothetical protein BN946_scf184999.g11 [Trametes cinnabarina]|uniref:C2H2-type domain-containing protein n=1 Tax=Pycnoporus cinnabarinus TaxID=5643 RepID=A0A060S823_PYCCI|nr:hypothetical protein BN946_scf184999.g11 [Trametes cinnabarina]